MTFLFDHIHGLFTPANPSPLHEIGFHWMPDDVKMFGAEGPRIQTALDFKTSNLDLSTSVEVTKSIASVW